MTSPCNPVDSLFQEPFYTHPCSEVTEDHSRNIILHQYVGCIKIPNQWAIPLDSVAVRLEVPAVVDLLVGSNLWHPEYGYFLITAYDKQGQKVQLQRTSDLDNAAPGTVVPGCTKFIITNPVRPQKRVFYGQKNWGPLTAVAPGFYSVTDVSVPGVRPGDFAQASFDAINRYFDYNYALVVNANIFENDIVSVGLLNLSTITSNLDAGTLRVRVEAF